MASSLPRAAANTLRSSTAGGSRPTLSSLRAPALARRRSGVPPEAFQIRGAPIPLAGILRDDMAVSTRPSHEPEYDMMADYRTSNFSPVPIRLMDGSEPGESVAAAVLSGAPVELQARTVRISKPAKPATQSGDWISHSWRMDWDVLPKGHRWENPLMGWQSSADAMQGTHLNFASREDAIRFAEKQGYEYFVQEPHTRHIAPKSYSANFAHSAKPLRAVWTQVKETA